MNNRRLALCLFVVFCVLPGGKATLLADEGSLTDDKLVEEFGFVSDDFNACALDETLWTFIDPDVGTTNASALRATGYAIEIDVPVSVAKASADDAALEEGLSVLRVPRIMQTVSDADFELDVRFNSNLNAPVQAQGLLIQGGGDDYVLVAVQQADGGPMVSASLVVSGTIETPPLIEVPISTGEAPIYLYLQRADDLWDLRYSFDGANYQPAGVFTHTLPVAAVGVFGSNQASGAPAGGSSTLTMIVDYVFRTDAPVVPQDGLVMYVDDLLMAVDPTVDAGSITGEPVTQTAGNPGCGNPMRLTATPATGWKFDQWLWQGVESYEPVLEGAFGFGEDIVAQFIRVQERLIYLPSIWADVD